MTLDELLAGTDGTDKERIKDPEQIITLLKKILALPLNRFEVYRRIPNSRGSPVESTLYVLYRQNILNPQSCTNWRQIMSRLQVCDLLVLFRRSIQLCTAPSLEPVEGSNAAVVKDPGNMLERICKISYKID